MLSRPPLLTRDLHPFEKAFYLYQRRLNERLALPFTRYFYYQKDTPADIDWKKKIKERLTAARDIGVYNAYGKEGWNDELLVGAKESEPEAQVEALLKDAEVEAEDEGPVKKAKVEKPMPRVTEADTSGDTRSLNRLMARTLYLVVKGSEGGWGFPSGVLMGKESLQRVWPTPKPQTPLTYAAANNTTGRRAATRPGRGREHEHLDRRTRPRRPPQSEVSPTPDRGGVEDPAVRREDFFHEGENNGWSGEFEG